MIHRFHLDEFYIVVDPCSASVHVVDEIAYELIGRYLTTPRDQLIEELARQFGQSLEEIGECYDQVTALKDQGILFSPDVFEPLAGTLKQKFLAAGYDAFILRYSTGSDAVWPNPLNDYEAAYDMILARADEWNIMKNGGLLLHD